MDQLPGYKHLGLYMRDYTFECPAGVWRARLDGKAWGKKKNILLFFSDADTDKKYCISLFFFTTYYRPEDGGFDFREAGNRGDVFELETAVGPTGRTRLVSARLIDPSAKTPDAATLETLASVS